jgi:hypothetical protein
MDNVIRSSLGTACDGMRSRLNTIAAVLVISASAALIGARLTTEHDWGDDFAQYILQARSVTDGSTSEFIKMNRFTVEQSTYPMGPVAYPWGFPVLLAPVYALLGFNVLALKAVGAVCFLLFLVVLWIGSRRTHANVWRLILLGLFALNPTILGFVDHIGADIPFLLASTAAVVLIGRIVVDRQRLISPLTDQLLLGAVVASAFLIRLNGVLLLVTLAFTQLMAILTAASRPDVSARERALGAGRRVWDEMFRSRRTTILSVSPYVCFIGIVVVWRFLLPDGGVSAQRTLFGNISIDAVQSNINLYIDIPAEFFGGFPHAIVLYGATLALGFAGVIARYRSDYHVIAYVALTLLMFLVWPATAGIRYLIPVLPFYVSFVLSTMERYSNSVHPARILRQGMCAGSIALVLLYFTADAARGAATNLAQHRTRLSGPFTDTSRSMFTYIRDHTEADSVIVFFKPRAMTLMTGRPSLKLHYVRHLLRGDYLALYKPDEILDQLLPDEVQCLTDIGIMHMVYKNNDFTVYRLDASTPNVQRASDCAVPRII